MHAGQRSRPRTQDLVDRLAARVLSEIEGGEIGAGGRNPTEGQCQLRRDTSPAERVAGMGAGQPDAGDVDATHVSLRPEGQPGCSVSADHRIRVESAQSPGHDERVVERTGGDVNPRQHRDEFSALHMSAQRRSSIWMTSRYEDTVIGGEPGVDVVHRTRWRPRAMSGYSNHRNVDSRRYVDGRW